MPLLWKLSEMKTIPYFVRRLVTETNHEIIILYKQLGRLVFDNVVGLFVVEHLVCRLLKLNAVWHMEINQS